MSPADICDVAYVLLVEQTERRVLADRGGLIARGVAEDLPALNEAQARLDEALASEPVAVQSVDSNEYRLRVALGVA